MAKKAFEFRGKSIEELKQMTEQEFASLLPARQRRSLTRGMPEQHKKLLENLKGGKNNCKTHCRDMIILPIMVGKTIRIHRGNRFEPVIIQEEMIGHYLGEFMLTRNRVSHSAPGIGATKSSAALSVK